jgi:hypothetical protein
LPFSCVLQFTSDPASLVRSFTLNILLRLLPSYHHHHHLRTPLSMSTQSPPLTRKPTSGPSQGVHSSLFYYFQWIDGPHGNVCGPSTGGLNFTSMIGLTCVHHPLTFRLFFEPAFLLCIIFSLLSEYWRGFYDRLSCSTLPSLSLLRGRALISPSFSSRAEFFSSRTFPFTFVP